MVDESKFPVDDLSWIHAVASTITAADASERTRNSVILGVQWGLHIHQKILAYIESNPHDQVGRTMLAEALQRFMWGISDQPPWAPIDETGNVDLVALGAALIAVVRAFQDNPQAQWLYKA